MDSNTPQSNSVGKLEWRL